MDIFQENTFMCPYCGALNSLEYDISGGARQQLIQDCEACCSAIYIDVSADNEGEVEMRVLREDE